jgi:glycosyltransferase involved in cell wall biosynthesis
MGPRPEPGRGAGGAMRILFCNYEYPPLGGGGGVVNALLAEELAKGHEVTVLTSRPTGYPAERVENGVRVVRVPVFSKRGKAVASMYSMLWYLPSGMRVGRKLVRAERFDVINTHFALPTGPVGHHLARYGGLPNVLSVHGGDLYDPSKATSPHRHAPLRAWVRHLVRSADRVVGQSANTLENLHRYYDPDIPALCIPLGIRRPPEGAADRAAYGCGADEVVLVTVGRLIARKAIDQLIGAVAEMRDLPVRLLVIGEGPLEGDLKAQAERLGVGDRVRFTGYVEEAEKSRILAMCDLYASTSLHEGFGLVFLEGMAAGLPVVCYDHGGQRDFLEDGRTGHLVPLGNTARFAEACRELVRDAGRRKEMGEACRARVEDYFIDRCAERYLAVFAEVAGKRA